MADTNIAHILVACSQDNHGDGSPRRTATPVANNGIWRHSEASSEFESTFLNGLQRSVNRKVQGSSPCPGAIFVCKFG